MRYRFGFMDSKVRIKIPPVAETRVQFFRMVFLALTLVVTLGLISTHLGGQGLQLKSISAQIGIGGLVQLKVIEEEDDLLIQSVIAFPDDEFLVVATTWDSRRELRGSCYLRFGGEDSQLYNAQILGTRSLGEGRKSIRCGLIQQEPYLKLDRSTRVSVRLESFGGKAIAITSSQIPLFFWNRIVYESLFTNQDVFLFTKGIFPARKEPEETALLNQTRCVFFDESGTHVLANSKALSLSQEIVRCEHPPPDILLSPLGNKISVTTTPGGTPQPSVAFYDEATAGGADNAAGGTEDAHKRHLVCACTMIYNGAKFLHEWIQYHSHLGVEKFILYDNNSEDKLDQTIQELNSDGSSATVVTRTWPWIKTQESGFSHCALAFRSECKWMAYIDVDEFIYPRHWLEREKVKGKQKGAIGEPADITGEGAGFAVDRTILSRLINDAEKQTFPVRNMSTGQISFYCLDFGPSGLTKHPEAGVTQGYTCRMGKVRRHKSLVRLDALDWSLTNVIHHFRLNPGYSTVSIPSRKGVVNHYKYQAWDEFKHKFKRRVSAYVVDWKENKSIRSQDRTPGLGNTDVKPKDWEKRFCEVKDTGLKDYVAKLFRLRCLRCTE